MTEQSIKRSRGRRAGQKADFTVEEIAVFERDLGKHRFELLMAAVTDDYKTMAHSFGLPTGTVKSRLHRARAMLAKLLDKAKHDAIARKVSA